LIKTFNILERSFLQQASEELNNGRRYKRIGSCALCCILTKEFVIVANAGDSKALLVSK
jgi:serine/threonine protein phosphatase PrpC